MVLGPEDIIKCEFCNWEGKVKDCDYSTSYDAVATIHTYRCPKCGGDIYNYTEDRVSDSAEMSDGSGSGEPKWLSYIPKLSGTVRGR